MLHRPGHPRVPGLGLRFRRLPYHADWPNGTATFPTLNLISSPVSLSKSGAVTGTYPVARFETDLPRIERPTTAAGSAVTTTPGRLHQPATRRGLLPWFHLLPGNNMDGLPAIRARSQAALKTPARRGGPLGDRL